MMTDIGTWFSPLGPMHATAASGPITAIFAVGSGNNGIVSSSTTHYNEIFLRAPNNEERSVEVAASGVSVAIWRMNSGMSMEVGQATTQGAS